MSMSASRSGSGSAGGGGGLGGDCARSHCSSWCRWAWRYGAAPGGVTELSSSCGEVGGVGREEQGGNEMRTWSRTRREDKQLEDSRVSHIFLSTPEMTPSYARTSTSPASLSSCMSGSAEAGCGEE